MEGQLEKPYAPQIHGLKVRSVANFLGDAHGWARAGIENHIQSLVNKAILQGTYDLAMWADEDKALPKEQAIRNAMLREFMYAVQSLVTSVEFGPAGIDAPRVSQLRQGGMAMIHPYREILCDIVGIPNPVQRWKKEEIEKLEAQKAAENGGLQESTGGVSEEANGDQAED